MKLKQAAAALGSKGGKAGRGKAKARTAEQARAAAFARWKCECGKPHYKTTDDGARLCKECFNACPITQVTTQVTTHENTNNNQLQGMARNSNGNHQNRYPRNVEDSATSAA